MPTKEELGNLTCELKAVNSEMNKAMLKLAEKDVEITRLKADLEHAEELEKKLLERIKSLSIAPQKLKELIEFRVATKWPLLNLLGESYESNEFAEEPEEFLVMKYLYGVLR